MTDAEFEEMHEKGRLLRKILERDFEDPNRRTTLVGLEDYLVRAVEEAQREYAKRHPQPAAKSKKGD